MNSLYYWLWKKLPDNVYIKLLILIVLLTTIIVFLITVIFPIIDPIVPGNEVNVGIDKANTITK